MLKFLIDKKIKNCTVRKKKQISVKTKNKFKTQWKSGRTDPEETQELSGPQGLVPIQLVQL